MAVLIGTPVCCWPVLQTSRRPPVPSYTRWSWNASVGRWASPSQAPRSPSTPSSSPVSLKAVWLRGTTFEIICYFIYSSFTLMQVLLSQAATVQSMFYQYMSSFGNQTCELASYIGWALLIRFSINKVIIVNTTIGFLKALYMPVKRHLCAVMFAGPVRYTLGIASWPLTATVWRANLSARQYTCSRWPENQSRWRSRNRESVSAVARTYWQPKFDKIASHINVGK